MCRSRLREMWRRYHGYDPKEKRKIVNCAIHTHESRMEVLLFFWKQIMWHSEVGAEENIRPEKPMQWA